MRILHLAYEDPAQPGSGGGSVRTLEINRRLAAHHEITALVAGYPGAEARVEAGIRWVPLGTRMGGKVDRLSYFALLGSALRRYDFDLLVEDFGAPFSVGFAPLFTRRPVVASVQWLFASQMRAKYHLPFDWVERAGLPLYNDFIAVSDWLARAIRARRPQATIEAIPNGVEEMAFSTQAALPRHLLFVGRLDIEQKGCDLLLESMVLAREALGTALPPLLLLGDGPDREMLEQQVRTLGLEEQVIFRGQVRGEEKYRLMASAHAVLMPSRFETFGMVAAEALAVGTPLVAFDVGPLREVAGAGGARLLPPFDVTAFAREMTALVSDGEQREALGQQGRRWARRYDWDQIARQQEAHYERALAHAPSPSLERRAS